MKKFADIFMAGLALCLVIALWQNIINFTIAFFDSSTPITLLTLSYLSPVFLSSFINTLLLYFPPCILVIWALNVFLNYSQVYITGLFAGLVLGLAANVPYVLLRIWQIQSLIYPLDPINLALSTFLCGIAGLYVYHKRDWKTKTQNQGPNSPPELQIESFNRPQPHGGYGWLLAWMAPPLIFICFCALMGIFSIQFIPFSTVADKVWCWRIGQSLKQEGYTVDKVIINREEDNPVFNRMEIRVSSVKHKDYLEYKDVILQVHRIIFENMDTSYLVPDDLGTIEVAIMDYYVGMYYISVDYETARQYQRNEITRAEYIQHWRFY